MIKYFLDWLPFLIHLIYFQFKQFLEKELKMEKIKEFVKLHPEFVCVKDALESIETLDGIKQQKIVKSSNDFCVTWIRKVPCFFVYCLPKSGFLLWYGLFGRNQSNVIP